MQDLSQGSNLLSYNKSWKQSRPTTSFCCNARISFDDAAVYSVKTYEQFKLWHYIINLEFWEVYNTNLVKQRNFFILDAM